jgi:hypothetical protein
MCTIDPAAPFETRFNGKKHQKEQVPPRMRKNGSCFSGADRECGTVVEHVTPKSRALSGDGHLEPRLDRSPWRPRVPAHTWRTRHRQNAVVSRHMAHKNETRKLWLESSSSPWRRLHSPMCCAEVHQKNCQSHQSCPIPRN